ncbi:hypothetical protein BDB00DRAFT_838893 [Zychaea mexicana]|uniref:uncharacterized protein n=1 Tax=Zychaea mexicana TaxID=64656 RepID=UPI0022FEA3F1|nr:uncharacterized protein BDB00DRAFT_838893 [Zychaea mexicana]KAI9490232.1 hypothetical protein BDB00DRAFT_838893 [Zychaea mexicana]
MDYIDMNSSMLLRKKLSLVLLVDPCSSSRRGNITVKCMDMDMCMIISLYVTTALFLCIGDRVKDTPHASAKIIYSHRCVPGVSQHINTYIGSSAIFPSRIKAKEDFLFHTLTWTMDVVQEQRCFVSAFYSNVAVRCKTCDDNDSSDDRILRQQL